MTVCFGALDGYLSHLHNDKVQRTANETFLCGDCGDYRYFFRCIGSIERSCVFDRPVYKAIWILKQRNTMIYICEC